MSATKPAFKTFTPEENASYRAWRFGSTLDWTTTILSELNYPIAENRWYVDSIQGICKGKEKRIAHSTLAKRAGKFINKSQSKELVKRARILNNEWARDRLYMIFDIQTPKPNEREGKEKRARTLYADYLTPAAVWAQDCEHRIKKADELRWKKDRDYRNEKREEILKEALKMLPSFDKAEHMPPDTEPKKSKPLSLSEYVVQREKILLAEKKRILERIEQGELLDDAEIDARLATLEVSHERTMHEMEHEYRATKQYLLKLKNTRLARAADVGDIDREETPEEAEKGNAHIPPIENGKPFIKGNADIPLSVSPEEAKTGAFDVEPDQQKGYVGVPLVEQDSAITQHDCAISYAAMGWPVFPVKPDKTPYTKNGFKDAVTDMKQIDDWWRIWPDADIGIPTGKASGLTVIDIDPRHGGDASISELDEEIGGLPPTAEATTPSGGGHLVFKNPSHVRIGNSAGKLGKGIDVRGEGGYIVAPGIKASRQWKNALDPAELPESIIERLLSEKHTPIDTDRKANYQPFIGGRFFSDGERNNGLRNVACGRWIHGYAVDASDLYQQMLQVRAERCASSRDPHDKSITDEWLYDMVIRTTRNYARGELKGSAV
jgi:hypothetical protein